MTAYRKGKIHDISVDLLNRDVDQPRKHFDDVELDALKKSIADKGLLYPVLFRIDDQDNLILVSGERRLKAFRSLGKETIPAMVVDNDRYDEIALIDNVQRVDLSPVDEAEAVHNLKTKYDYTQEQLGNILGKAQNTISIILDLMNISEVVRNQARQNKDVSRTALLTIAKIKSAKAQQKAYDALVAKLSTPKKSIKRPRLKDTEKTIKVTDTTMEHIKAIKVEALGDDKNVVVEKLQQLLQEIQDKLTSIGSC